MKIEQIEKILRKAPAPKVPADLLQKLRADMRTPRAAAAPAAEWNSQPSWARRWLPALSFAPLFLACLVAVAVQTNILSELQRENGELRAAKDNLDALRAENAEYQRLAVANQELDRLRKDNAELLKLRGEVRQLQTQLKDGENVRAENRLLLATANQARAAAGTNGDFFAEAKAKAERIQCVNNLKQIGLAARIWAGDNNDVYPSNFLCMSNELGGSWKILQCPSDKSHNVTNWAEVAAGNISYIMDAPGISETFPSVVFAECSIHHTVCLVDGSVQMLSEEGYKKRVKIIDGRKEMVTP